MGQFNAMKLTNKGLALFNKVQSGTQLQLTKIAIGDGSLSAGQTLESLTALVNKTQDLTIIGTTNNEDGTVSVQTTISNQGLLTGKYIREIGLYATDPIEGEILYSVTNAGILADYLPPEGTNIVENIINIVANTGNASSVNAVIDKSLIYASAAEIGDMSKVTGATNVADKLVQHETALADIPNQVDQSKSLSSPNKEKKAIFTFIVDDGKLAHLTKLLPIVQEKNIPLGVAVVTNIIGSTGMTWEQLKQFTDLGCELLSHGHTHVDLTTLSLADLENELKTSQSILRSKGYDTFGVVCPYNASSPTVRDLAKKYYKYMFARAGASGGNGINYPKFTNYMIGRTALGSFFDTPSALYINQDTTSLDYYKERVDKAIQNNAWLTFVLHDQSEFDATQQQYARDVIDYIRGLGYEIVSPNEGFIRMGNIIEIGDCNSNDKFFINAQGREDSYNIGIEVTPINHHSILDRSSVYKQFRRTITPITSSFAVSEGFPDNQPGYLITDLSYGIYNYRYQIYEQVAGQKYRYIRYVDSNYDWLSWIKIGRVVPLVATSQSSSVTIPANSTVSINLSGLTGVKPNDVVSVRPSPNPSSGTVWSLVYGYTDGVLIRIANVTTVDITIPIITWTANVS